MKTYKITNTNNPNWAAYQNFASLEDAQTYTTSLGSTYNVELASPEYQIPEPTPEEKYVYDKQFGSVLIDTFLIDNRLIIPAVTPTESLQLLNQFQDIEKLASLGDIKSVQVLLNQIVVDDRLFTQERKDRYMGMINSYLG